MYIHNIDNVYLHLDISKKNKCGTPMSSQPRDTKVGSSSPYATGTEVHYARTILFAGSSAYTPPH